MPYLIVGLIVVGIIMFVIGSLSQWPKKRYTERQFDLSFEDKREILASLKGQMVDLQLTHQNVRGTVGELGEATVTLHDALIFDEDSTSRQFAPIVIELDAIMMIYEDKRKVA